MRIAICQMMNLQRLQQMIDVFRASPGLWERLLCRGSPAQYQPGEYPRRGSSCGLSSKVASQFHKATAS